jgi:hypothetical protein
MKAAAKSHRIVTSALFSAHGEPRAPIDKIVIGFQF